MSTITVEVTPTHRYFARKRKDDIIRWIVDLRRWVNEGPTEYTLEELSAKRKQTCDELAAEAMSLFRKLPPA